MPRKNPPPRSGRRGASRVKGALADHPGLAAAHDGPVRPEDCQHPKQRRDLKNPDLCMVCGRPVGDRS